MSPPISEPPAAPLTQSQRLWLFAIVAGGLGVRILYLAHAVRTPGYVYEDPDGYMAQALRLAGPGGWQWTFEAVTYTINGQHHALPPMYSVFLSVFASLPGFPLSAQVAQAGLAAVTIALIFQLGRLLHSPHCGLLAGAAFALWVPSIFSVWSTSQETLYIPLLLFAFWLLARAMHRDRAPARFLLPGVVFGTAALTRSMPLFFVLPAALLHVRLSPHRRRASMQSAVFLSGFLLIAGPYSAALSRHFGQLTIIDTHGSIHLGAAGGELAPSLSETARALWGRFAGDPDEYVAGALARARSLLYVNGGRILQIYVVTGTRTEAALWKLFVHAGTDILLIAGACLAPLGAVFSRWRALAAMLALWTVTNVAIASVGGFGGARLRAPFEPVLLMFAGVVAAGGWRRPGVPWLGAGLVASAIVAAAVVPQLQRSLTGRPDYGIRWPSIFSRQSGRVQGEAGFSVPAYDGVADVTLTSRDPAHVHVRVGGVGIQDLQVRAGETRQIRALWPARGFAYVELVARDPSGGPASVQVGLEPR